MLQFLKQRWGEMFGASFEVLLYDLTSTYFETDQDRGPQELRQFGYSRDKRGDCRQIVIALIVTPEGFPLSYEVLAGNTADCTTLGEMLGRIEQRYGKAQRIWVMDRGIPTEESLAKMREMGASYLVGTPKARLGKLEQRLLEQPWAKVREGVQVKRLACDDDVYILAQSDARIDKERAMRRKRLRRYWQRLQALQRQALTRDQLLIKLGAAKHDAGRAAGLVKILLPKASEKTATTALEFQLDRDKLRVQRQREGRYLLRTNVGAGAPEQLWSFYIQLTEVEQAFNLETVVGRARAGRHRVGWQGATMPLGSACKEEQRRQRARGRSDRVRSAFTQEVKLIGARNINIHAGFVRITSGQLPFLGSRNSSTTWRCGRSTISSNIEFKRTCSWPFWRTACKSRSRPSSSNMRRT